MKNTMRPWRPLAVAAAILGVSFAARSGWASDSGSWPGFRGEKADGVSSETGIFEGGARLDLVWKRPLGSGYSGISVAGGRAVTMFQDGEFDAVVALDCTDGRELWRYRIDATYRGHDGSQDGPIPTPYIADGRVFALAPRGKLVALDAATGREVWKIDLVADYGVVKPHWGFGTSPLIARGVLIVEVGAKHGMAFGFDPSNGRRLWAAGDDSVNYQSPIHHVHAGRSHVLAVGDKKLFCIEPESGQVLWEYAHEGGGERGSVCLVPVSIDSSRILLKHQDDRSRLLEVNHHDGRTDFRSLWEGQSIGKTYAVAVHHGEFLYGYVGRTLTCVDVETGATRWRSREPGDGFPIIVDNHLIVLTKDGGVHVAKADPRRFEEVAGLKVFGRDDLCWAPPAFADGSVYARSFREIARIAIRRGDSPVLAGQASDSDITGTRLGQFLSQLRETDDKRSAIDRFLASVDQFPMIESGGRVVFIYRGAGDDVVLGGDLTGYGAKQSMTRVPGTDLFYCVSRLEPDARVSYAFVRDFKAISDPLNPRKTKGSGFDDDLEFAYANTDTELSWLAMPQWKPPTHLDPPEESRRGRVESQKFSSHALGAEIAVDVYTPAGYERGTEPLPVAYFHDGPLARGELHLVDTLDNLIGRSVAPVIAVFINHQPPLFGDLSAYAKMTGEELPAFIDGKYRTIRSRNGRGHVASGFAGSAAIYTVFAHPDMADKLGVQSPYMIGVTAIEPIMKNASAAPLRIYLDWCKYDLRSRLERWNVAETARTVDRYLRDHGYRPVGGEAHDGSGAASWQNRTDDLLEALFPSK